MKNSVMILFFVFVATSAELLYVAEYARHGHWTPKALIHGLKVNGVEVPVPFTDDEKHLTTRGLYECFERGLESR